MKSNDIINEISFLYELSLSIGQSLDLKDNCQLFFKTLMSRKNIEQTFFWIENVNMPLSDCNTGYSLAYGYPKSKIKYHTLPQTSLIKDILEEKGAFSGRLSTEQLIHLGIEDRFLFTGDYILFSVPNLGFLIFTSSKKNYSWNTQELNQLRNVLKKFSISVQACLIHQRSLHDLEVIEKTKIDLEIAKSKAEESDKLKTAFLSNITHEIRTPLNAILGFSNVLVNNIEAENRQAYVDSIEENGEKLFKIIDNIIQASKLEANQLEIEYSSLGLNQIIREVYESYIPATSNVEFKLLLPSSREFTIDSDKNKLIQIFDNLLSNAFKFTISGDVSIGYIIDFKSGRPVFFVRDTGVGIPEKYQKDIFDSFRQVDCDSKRKFGGSGIGLTICKRLLTLLNGNIWIDSSENKGTTVYFTLDQEVDTLFYQKEKQKEEPNTLVKKETTDDSPFYNFKGKNILIAEDVESNYNYLSAILELTNANIYWAVDGQEAVKLACSNPDYDLDLILMDIRMPKLNGVSAIKKIRQCNLNIPIIVQTAFALEEDQDNCFKAGADDIILKPINPEDLLKCIKKYI